MGEGASNVNSVEDFGMLLVTCSKYFSNQAPPRSEMLSSRCPVLTAILIKQDL